MDIHTILKHSIPRRESELLLARVLQKPREFLLAHPEMKISKLQETRYKYLSWKLRCGYPLAYLIGHREFYGLDFLVDKHTLVPRPETELMVELAVAKMQNAECRMQNCVLIDVGTGSGCIPISIMKTFQNVILNEVKDLVDSTPRSFDSSRSAPFALFEPEPQSRRQDDVRCYATDISRGALNVAKKNAKKHAVDITFLHGNLLQPLTNHRSLIADRCSLIITANLPYLTQNQFDSESSIQKEPHSALVANDNGLALYKELLEQIKLLVTNSELRITLFMEIDPNQTAPLTSHCTKQFPHGTIQTHTDLLGHDRIVSLTL